MLKLIAYHIKGAAKATCYSLLGLRYALTKERAFQVESFLSIVMIPAALYLGDGFLEKSVLLIVWLLIPIVELLNSAVEAVVDRVGVEFNELSGRAKDLGSAAVFLCIILFFTVWGMKLADLYNILKTAA